MYHDSGGSLQQNLINVARRFENERAQEIARLRSQCQSANVRADAEMDKLKVERARSAELEQKLKEEAAQAAAHSERADGLQEQCTPAIGCRRLAASSSWLTCDPALRSWLRSTRATRRRPPASSVSSLMRLWEVKERTPSHPPPSQASARTASIMTRRRARRRRQR